MARAKDPIKPRASRAGVPDWPFGPRFSKRIGRAAGLDHKGKARQPLADSGITSVVASAGDDGKAVPCVHKDFKTELVKQACEKGGQLAAKDAMKAFNKKNNINSCNKCHTKLAPTYELKDDAYDQFTKLGGKLIPGKGGGKGTGGGGGGGTGKGSAAPFEGGECAGLRCLAISRRAIISSCGLNCNQKWSKLTLRRSPICLMSF